MLKELRIQRSLTQEQVAKALGITTSYYGMIEIGTRNPTLKLAKKIADFFNKPIEEIFFDIKTTHCCLGELDQQKQEVS